jgi:predicted Rossmann-fold nucleotide-binding protein
MRNKERHDRPRTVPRFRVTPEGTGLETLSPSEVDALFAESHDAIQPLLRRCALAVLTSGEESDDVKTLARRYSDFALEVVRTAGGIEVELEHAPAQAFVSYEHGPRGSKESTYKIIEGARQNIFAVLRDLAFVRSEMQRTGKFDTASPAGITDAVYQILRNAGIFRKTGRHKVVACWGGHAIGPDEYEYTKRVGYQCGLRLMDIITGCGPGAMKGPMKGAAIAHSKQRLADGRYIGLTEPGIIASEAPNAIVDPLVIMPDIEKRLEAFVRLGHGVIVFPGGAGTAEELMYLLGVLAHERNAELPFPLVLTGPAASAPYLEHLDRFVRNTLGERAAARYRIIVDDPIAVAVELNRGLLEVKASREHTGNSYYFNRAIHIPAVFQEPFAPSHAAVAALRVDPADAPHRFAAALRRVFSAVVWGNVKPDGVHAVEDHGPLTIHGEPRVMAAVDELLGAFVDQGRMRLSGEYTPVYSIVR